MILFVDRDLGKRLGVALRTVHVQVVNHIDRYPKADAESVPDTLWIAEATAKGEVLITRDGGIRRRDVEIRAIVAAGGRCFVLETGNASPLIYLRALMVAWPRIEYLVENEPAPFVFGISRTGRVTKRYPN